MNSTISGKHLLALGITLGLIVSGFGVKDGFSRLIHAQAPLIQNGASVQAANSAGQASDGASAAASSAAGQAGNAAASQANDSSKTSTQEMMPGMSPFQQLFAQQLLNNPAFQSLTGLGGPGLTNSSNPTTQLLCGNATSSGAGSVAKPQAGGMAGSASLASPDSSIPSHNSSKGDATDENSGAIENSAGLNTGAQP